MSILYVYVWAISLDLPLLRPLLVGRTGASFA